MANIKQDPNEELERLQLEEAREAAEERRALRDAKAARAVAIQEALRRDRESEERLQSLCVHRKGGKGPGQFYAGNDSNYAVITHTCSWGKTIVICQRCGKQWNPPDPLPRNATPEQRAQYKLDVAEYRMARNFPTDNEPSGSVLFTFNRVEEART